MNVTGTEGRKFTPEEIATLAQESDERKAPSWVGQALRKQIDGGSE